MQILKREWGKVKITQGNVILERRNVVLERGKVKKGCGNATQNRVTAVILPFISCLAVRE